MDALVDTIAEKRRHSQTVSIIVNGREKTVPKREISFEDLIKLAYENPPTGEFICFTVAYRKEPARHKTGTLTEGETVKIKKGMIFDVTFTDKS